MLYRNIDLSYKLSDDKTLLTVNYIEENKTGYKNIIKEYDLINIDDTMKLYNTMLDDIKEQIKTEYQKETKKDDGFYNVKANKLEKEFTIIDKFYNEFYNNIY